MEVKRNVRMRRMERIKQLVGIETRAEQSAAPNLTNNESDLGSIYDINFKLGQSYDGVQPGNYLDDRVLDPRMQDPEYVWKQKNKKGLFNETKYLSQEKSQRPWLRRFWLRGVVCLVIFALVWGIFQIRHPYAEKAKGYVIQALTDPLEFDTVATWFKQTFGDTPSFIPAFRSGQKQEETINASLGNKRTYFAPLQGYVTIPFVQSKTGVLLQTKTGAPASAFDEGQVVLVDTTEDTGLTVSIKHPSGVQSTYGWLEKSNVVVNDWVKGGDTIGFASKNDRKGTGMLYFAIKLDKTYVNPVEVVSFD